MLIFDSFPSRDNALAFAETVRKKHRLSARVYSSQEESDAVDPFPFELTPPIVLVERPDRQDIGQEEEIEASVELFKGQFAGT